jgi:predicted NBD/HSP70 family sugar kinase
MRLDAEGNDLLSRRRVPLLIPEQISRFSLQSLRAKSKRHFDPRAALLTLRADAQKTVLAVDIGGDKMVVGWYAVRDGLLVQITESLIVRGEGGSGYLKLLEELALRIRQDSVAVGISSAGVVEGTRLLTSPNVSVFLEAMNDRYGGDFANLFPWVTVTNDAEAGIMAGALEAVKCHPPTRHVVYIINGSGLGGALLSDNVVIATEPGHIEVVAELNPFDQRRSCGVLGATHVCLERIAAAKAGVEDLWFQQKGERLDGTSISTRYLAGDQLALELYDNSALITAHAIKGMIRAFNLSDDLERTVVVGHGGIFHVPGYATRLESILNISLSRAPNMIFTKDFSTNACLDGGAIAAAAGKQPEPEARKG